jgi:fluoroacetyl-CoA thioesterase
MKDSLKPGLTFQFKFAVPENKTVPYLFPEATEFQVMPNVLATGYMVGLFEWACIQALRPHLDWPAEQTVGVGINVTHTAATPPGFTVTVNVKLEKVEGRKLNFSITADDGLDSISEGTHERFVIDAGKFNAKLSEKIKKKAPNEIGAVTET